MFHKTMSIRHKLYMMIGVFLLPIVLMSFLFVRQSLKDIDFAKRELVGVAALQAVWPVLTELNGQRALGSAPAATEFEAEAGPLTTLVATEVEAFADGLAGNNDEATATTTATAAQNLINLIADRSNLTLDPDLDSYYLMDAAAFKAPDTSRRAADMVQLIRNDLAKSALNDDEKAELVVATGQFEAAFTAQLISIHRAIDNNPALASDFEAPLQAFAGDAQRLHADARAAAQALREPALAGTVDINGLSRDYATLRQSADTLVTLTNSRLSSLLVKREAGFSTQMLTLLGIAALGTVLAIFMGLALSRSVIRSIDGLDRNIRLLAQENLDAEITEARRGDEIGQIGRAIEVFRRATIEKIADASNDVKRNEMVVKEKQRISNLTDLIRKTIADIMETVRASSGAINDSTGQFGRAAMETRRDVAQAIESLGASSEDVNRVSQNMSDVSASFSDISGRTQESARMTGDVSRQITRSGELAGELSIEVQRIGEVSRLIKTISSQTNLLALNATIEAARAGEAGRGFAVVAGEVKSLAAQTARATMEIEAQIDDVRQATEQMIASVGDISSVIAEVNHSSDAVAGAVQTQSQLAYDIRVGLERAAAGNNDAVKAISTLPEATRRTEETSQKMQAIAVDLERLSTDMETRLSGLLAEMVDNRIAARYASTEHLDVTHNAQNHSRIRLLDISEGGARLGLTEGLASGDPVVLHLPDADISATVVWVGRDSCGVDLGEVRLKQVVVMKLAA